MAFRLRIYLQAFLSNASCHSLVSLLERGFGLSHCWNLGFEQSESGAQTCRRRFVGKHVKTNALITTDHGAMEGMGRI